MTATHATVRHLTSKVEGLGHKIFMDNFFLSPQTFWWFGQTLTNMDPPPAEGNFCDDSNCPMKHHIVEQYNRHMSYVDNSDCMANSYSMSGPQSEHLLDLTVFNSWILLSLCGAKYTHRDFRLLLARNLIEEAGKSQDRPIPRLVGRPSAAATNVLRLESRHNKHCPAKSSTHLQCCLCSSRGQRKRTVYL